MMCLRVRRVAQTPSSVSSELRARRTLSWSAVVQLGPLFRLQLGLTWCLLRQRQKLTLVLAKNDELQQLQKADQQAKAGLLVKTDEGAAAEALPVR